MWQGNDRFKGLDPVNSVPEELWVEVRNTVQEGKRTKPPQREGRARGTGSLRRPYKQLKEGEEGKAREKGKAHPTERRAPKSSTEGREGLLQRAPQETGRKQQKHKDRDSAGKRERGHLAKDRNGRELADAREISKRWKEYTELYKKDANELGYYGCVVSQPEPGILESKVKRASGSTAGNKASGGGVNSRVRVNNSSRVTQSLKRMMPSRCCIQYVSKSGRPSSGHGTGKGQSSSQFPRKVVLKNVPTIGQSHSSPMLVWSCLKFCMLGFSVMQTKNFHMSELVLEREEEPEIKLPIFPGS